MDGMEDRKIEPVFTFTIYPSLQDVCGGGLGSISSFHQAVSSHLLRLSRGFIYHKERMAVSVSAKNGLQCLTGALHEVSLLFPSSCIEIRDSDGEFLLIEASLHLPLWVTPEVIEGSNRVWYHQGQLHLVPLPRTPEEQRLIPASPSIKEAIALVCGREVDTLAPPAAQGVIRGRVTMFPQEALDNMHTVRATVPVGVAHVLHHAPSLIASTIEAFSTDRAPQDIATCNSMTHFKPTPNVEVNVTMSRLQYATMNHQQFSTPRAFLASGLEESDPSVSVGMKIACGFEILWQRFHKGSGKPSMDGDASFNNFLEKLKGSGFFKGEREGSKVYKELLLTAQQYFMEKVRGREDTVEGDGSDGDGEAGGSRGRYEARCRRLLLSVESIPLSMEVFPPPEALKPADSVEWMHVDQTDLDTLLAGQMKEFQDYDFANEEESPLSEGESTDEEGEGDGLVDRKVSNRKLPATLIHSMKSFVDTVSSHEGAERSVDVSVPSYYQDDMAAHEGVAFDVETFFSILKGIPAGGDSLSSLFGVGGDGSIAAPSPSPSASLLAASPGECEGGGQGEEDLLDEAVLELMAEMDEELFNNKSVMWKSFAKTTDIVGGKREGDVAGEKEKEDLGSSSLQEVDIDVNLVKNLLESFTLQGGAAGPSSNLLRELGVRLE